MKTTLAAASGLLVLWGWLSASPSAKDPPPAPAETRWWKGNTHTHTLWSDGNAAPEWVVDWYRKHGYHFLVLSDHNILSEGEKLFPVQADGRLTAQNVSELQRRFGADRVDLRGEGEALAMRLWTLSELRAEFEAPDRFLLVQGEEVTDQFERHPVHVNALNLREVIAPAGGASLRATLQNNIDAILDQGRRLGRPVLAHINHPNFGWGLSWEDVAAVQGDRFFEVYNGHSAVRNHGDAEHPSTEQMWDLALTQRLTRTRLGLLHGVATDDSHDYFSWGVGKTNPGRGWLMVRASELSAAALIGALHRGDFYASSGVEVDFQHDAEAYRVEVHAEPGLRYRIRFLGTRRQDGATGPPGELLAEQEATQARYEFHGDEVYVRAEVISSRLHPNPYAHGDPEKAWLPPRAVEPGG